MSVCYKLNLFYTRSTFRSIKITLRLLSWTGKSLRFLYLVQLSFPVKKAPVSIIILLPLKWTSYGSHVLQQVPSRHGTDGNQYSPPERSEYLEPD
jgi:hypothetical protein